MKNLFKIGYSCNIDSNGRVNQFNRLAEIYQQNRLKLIKNDTVAILTIPRFDLNF